MAEFSTTTITPADGVQLPAVNGNTAGNMTLQSVSNYNKTKLDIQNNLTSTATDKPLSAYQGKLLNDNKVNTSDIVDDVLTQDTEKPLSANMGYELQAEIDNLKARGRFLSLWNCATGLPSTNPTTLPYTYKAGDYYIISSVASTTNYKPNGSSYTGSASGTVESNTPSPNDFYEYDGTSWLLLINSGKTATFANLGGSPSDNQALASALAAKQNTLTFDSTPTSGSSNPVTSDGINSAISAITAYSTSETVCGTWNGATLYRKVFETTISSGTSSLTLSIGSASNYIKSIKVWTYNLENYGVSVPYYNPSANDWMFYYISPNGEAHFSRGVTSSDNTIIMIVEYIK